MGIYYGDDFNEIKIGKKHLYVWGIALYKSMFEEAGEHITKFCVKATNITGDPTLPYSDGILGMDFNFTPIHNCSDEDCSI